MEKDEYSNKHENMNCNEMEHFDIGEQHIGETSSDWNYFEYLYNLKEENPWEERDFNSIFMYL